MMLRSWSRLGGVLGPQYVRDQSDPGTTAAAGRYEEAVLAHGETGWRREHRVESARTPRATRTIRT